MDTIISKSQRDLNIITKAIELGFVPNGEERFNNVVYSAERFILANDDSPMIVKAACTKTFDFFSYTDENLFFFSGEPTFLDGNWEGNYFFLKNDNGEFEMADNSLLEEDQVCYINFMNIVNSNGKKVRLVARTHF